jgi:hypothetical protein
MLSIVIAALLSRRSSTVALWLLACLVIARAVATPASAATVATPDRWSS